MADALSCYFMKGARGALGLPYARTVLCLRAMPAPAQLINTGWSCESDPHKTQKLVVWVGRLGQAGGQWVPGMKLHGSPLALESSGPLSSAIRAGDHHMAIQKTRGPDVHSYASKESSTHPQVPCGWQTGVG